MAKSQHGVNVIKVGDVTLLLTEVGGGEVVHLAVEKAEGGREAVYEFQLDSARGVSSARNYERTELLERRWSPKTLCGRKWAAMSGGDGGPVTLFGDVAFAPSCRRCLNVMDRYFPNPSEHNRLGLIAQVVADLVSEYGVAAIHHVPGDQQAALRKAVRLLVRKQNGHGSSTIVVGDTIHISCDAIYDQRREEHNRAAMEAVSQMLGGNELRQIRQPEWQISWDTWTAGG